MSERKGTRLKRGDWVMNDNDPHAPTFGRVTDCWRDDIGEAASIRTYDAEGRAGHVEPAIPTTQLTPIQKPAFPLKLDLYGGYVHNFAPTD